MKDHPRYRLSRRDFLGACAKGGLVLGAAVSAPGLVLDAIASEQVRPRVAVANGSPEQAVKQAIEALGGISNFVKPGDRVLLKPNMSFANPPEWGTTTNPSVVKTVAQLCVDAGAGRVLVVDHPLGDADRCKERTGIWTALEGMDRVKTLFLSEQRLFQEIEVPEGRTMRKVEVARPLLTSDVLISLPAAKSHTATRVSLSLKGLMGLIWDRGAMHRGESLHDGIADLGTVLRSDLVLVDASRALLTRGPNGPGKVVELNTIVASADPLAADACALSLTPWQDRALTASDVKHLQFAHERGLGEADLEKMEIVKIS